MASGSSSFSAILISAALNSWGIPPALSGNFTLDFWDSETDYRNFLTANHEPHQALDRSFREFTLQERQISSFILNLSLGPASYANNPTSPSGGKSG